DVAGEERKLHTGTPLGDAVAHGRRAAGDLCGSAGLARRVLDDVGIAAERLVRARHVVVAGDAADVRGAAGQAQLVAQGRGGEGVGEISAGEMRAPRAGLPRLLDPFEIARACVAAPL